MLSALFSFPALFHGGERGVLWFHCKYFVVGCCYMHSRDVIVEEKHCGTCERFWRLSLTPKSHRSHVTSPKSYNMNNYWRGKKKKKTFLTQQWGSKATLWTSKYCRSNPLMRETDVFWQKTCVDPYCSVLWVEFSNLNLENFLGGR